MCKDFSKIIKTAENLQFNNKTTKIKIKNHNLHHNSIKPHQNDSITTTKVAN